MFSDEVMKLPQVKEKLLQIRTYLNSPQLGTKMQIHLANNTLGDLLKEFDTTMSIYIDYINYVTEYPDHSDGYPVCFNEFIDNDWGME
jgi:hypothetical protein